MAWNVIRRATVADTEALRAAAVSFASKHDIDIYEDQGTLEAVEAALWMPMDGEPKSRREEQARLRAAWLRMVRRALNDPRAEGIGWGTVGYSIE